MKMPYVFPCEKIHFLTRIYKSFDFGRDWDILWKKFNNGTFIVLQRRYLTANVFKFHAWGQKCHFRNCQFGTFDPVHGIWNVMATLGPGWQMLDSFGFWWTWVNEIRNLSSFLQGGLNGGVTFYPTWYLHFLPSQKYMAVAKIWSF